MVPSSPYKPCNTGNAISKLFKYSNSFSIFSNSVISSPTCNGTMSCTGFVYLYYSQLLLIYIGRISYFCLSKLEIIEVPEDIETSCSVDIPPNITPIFFIVFPLFLTNSFTNFCKFHII